MNGTTRPLILAFDNHASDEPTHTEFTLPDDLTGLSAEFDEAGTLVGGDLADLEAQAVAAFDAVRSGPLDAEAIEVLSALTSAIEAIRAEASARVTAAAEAAAAAEELAARVHPDTALATEATEATEDDEATEDGDQPEDGTPAVEAAAEGTAAVEAATETPETPETPEAVTAAARPRRIRVPMAAIRSAQRPEDEPSPEGAAITITAAADLPGYTPGTSLPDLDSVARALHGRARRLGNGHQAPVASIAIPAQHRVTDGMSAAQVGDVINQARNPQALVAAGGWCAPSSIRREFFSIEATTGLWDAPEIGVEDGGIEFILDGGPSIADVIGTDAVWLWTEANDIAAASNDGGVDDVLKPCVTIPCPTWDEERLAMHGICVGNGNLADLAFPANTRRYLDLVLAAHVHTLNGRRLAAVEALADPVTLGATAFGAAPAILGGVELQVLDIKDKFRMDDNAVLEVVLPMWARAAIRSDLAKRMGVDLLSVTNAQIDAAFAMRGARVQFVYDWQALQTGPNLAAAVDGFRESYPATVKALVYPAGTYVNGRGPTLELGVMRDSAQVAVNDHTAAFTEEAWLTFKAGHEGRVVTIPFVPSGATHGGLTDTEAADPGY